MVLFIIGSVTILNLDMGTHPPPPGPPKHGHSHRQPPNPPIVPKNVKAKDNEKYNNKRETTSTTTDTSTKYTTQKPATEPTNFDKTESKNPTKKRLDVGLDSNSFEINNPYNKIDKVYKENEKQNQQRASKVRDAMKFAWDNYVKYNWGGDELRPITKGDHDWFSLGLTIIDSLDTLYIMELHQEFDKAKDWIKNDLDLAKNTRHSVSVFETIIRFLGGFLSTYHLSGDQVFLDKAEQMGHLLLKAFDGKSPFPKTYLHLSDGNARYEDAHCVILAQIGTLFLEFNHLSEVTGNPIWKHTSDKALNALASMKTKYPGLIPSKVKQDASGFCEDHYSIAAMTDSYYEYLLKMWIYQDKTNSQYKDLYNTAAKSALEYLYKQTTKGDYYMANFINGHPTSTQEHLACFTGGMFALGAAANVSESEEMNEFYMEAGKQITATCAKTYFNMPTGVGPEVAGFSSDGSIYAQVQYYILRPETVESLFILYRLTGDTKYQEWAWRIFEAIEKNCKTENGYSGLRDVGSPHSKDDLQESFFMAETLKYLYLIFKDSSVIPLDKYVFNTEAHPFPIQFDYVQK
ncbi:hypothetical protein CYY_001131 [Polysphondylium violaceum]|uniref:alpha-1,2-Mannosidase n=1 Tax=Polysphondylium violaceum TaxID=133409 RepID=A0A8J4Q2M5_9MYCE|nr:hypothetical protein CYY_001131 [Polysphondylium violaceum]